jgi:YidC/Oxa1 family membrane protein insertase
MEVYGLLASGYGDWPIIKQIAWLLGQVMNGIFNVLSKIGIENIGVCIIIFTIIIYTLMIPLTIKQQKFSKMSSLMNPELQKVQKKYQNRKDEKSMRMMQAETQAIYDKYGASPTGGCLPMLIQLPILFALYRVIYNVPAYVEPVREIYEHIAQPIMSASGAGDIMTTLIQEMSLRVTNFDITDIDKVIDALYVVKSTGWSIISDAFSGNADVVNAISQYSTEIIRMNSLPGGLNIADAPVIFSKGISGIFPGVLIPILAGVSQWANLKVSQRNQPKPDLDSTMGSTMNTMNMMMPLMSVFFCITLPSGMGLYWIASAVFRTIIYLFIDKFFNNKSVDEIIDANKEKAAKKAEKRGEQNAKLEEYAAMKTKNIDRRSISQIANTNKGDTDSKTARRLTRTVQRLIKSLFPDMHIC